MIKSLIYLLLALIVSVPVTAQNVYEFYFASYAKGRQLSNVTFDYSLNGRKIKKELSKSGEMTFVVMQDKGRYVMKAESEGNATKYIYFNTENYPFEFEYELQDVAVEYVSLDKMELDYQMGEVMWIHHDEVFAIVEIDSSMLPESQPVYSDMDKMSQTYDLAIKNGDEMFELKQYGHAISYFEVALFSKPEDGYAHAMLEKCKEMRKAETKEYTSEQPKPTVAATGAATVAGSTAKPSSNTDNAVIVDAVLLDQINKGQVNSVDPSHINEEVIFSVQLGAFASGTDASKFPGVSDLKIIPYDDFTRAFSGEFTDVNKAISRRKEMRSGIYKDAFIVKMKGNKGIGF